MTRYFAKYCGRSNSKVEVEGYRFDWLDGREHEVDQVTADSLDRDKSVGPGGKKIKTFTIRVEGMQKREEE